MGMLRKSAAAGLILFFMAGAFNAGISAQSPTSSTSPTTYPSELLPLLQKARAGDVDSQMALAYYFAENGATQDYAEATKWFLKAAEQGNIQGQERIAYLCAKGIGVKVDQTQAFKWYLRATEKCPLAKLEVARRYAAGDGVEKNVIEAVKWYEPFMTSDSMDYREAIEHGCELDYYKYQIQSATLEAIGGCYMNGEGGTTKDPVKADMYYYKILETDPGPDILLRMARRYAKGDGVAKDPVKAFECYSDLNRLRSNTAIECHIESDVICEIASCYETGFGTEKNMEEAISLYTGVAEGGYIPAQLKLADIYFANYLADSKTDENYSTAMKWLDRASRNGSDIASLSIAKIYYEGHREIPKDLVMAVAFYRRAAEQKSVEAMMMLGNFYSKDPQGINDPAEAIKWYRLASEQGNTIAAEELKRLGAKP